MNMQKLVLAASLAAAIAQPAPAADKYRIGYLRVMDDAPAILAKDAGFYQKHGLDAEMVEFKSGTDLIKAIVGGQLDSGVLGFTNALTWASKGADLKVVGGAQNGYHAMIVREDAGIRQLSDLKGKTLASQAEGSTADVVLKGVVFKQAGLKPDDVNVMGVSPQVAVQSLVSKRADAAFLFEPQATIAKLVAPVKQIYEVGAVWPFPCMVVITSGETLKKKKDLVWKSLDAQLEAIDMLKQKPEQAATYLADDFISEPKLKTMKGEVPREAVITDAIKSQTFSAALSEKDQARMREIAAIMHQQGSLKTRDGKPFDVGQVIDLAWQKDRKL